MSCTLCGHKFIKTITRAAAVPICRKSRDKTHDHFGKKMEQYGVCKGNHYTRIRRLDIEWDKCGKCRTDQDSLASKRRFMAAKARRQKKEVPTFLRDELDKFKQDMEEKMEQRIQDEVDARFRRLNVQTDKVLMALLPDLPSPPGSPPSPPDPPSPTYFFSTYANCVQESIRRRARKRGSRSHVRSSSVRHRITSRSPRSPSGSDSTPPPPPPWPPNSPVYLF